MNILITGGAGFIGCNAVQYFSSKGHTVFVIDNLSRETARVNKNWMEEENVPFNFTKLDIVDFTELERYFKQNSFDVVIHLAAQVAVTLSVQNPQYDFNVNALGTFNILECIRKYCPKTIFINASTNKVYGKISDKKIVEEEMRYHYQNKKDLGVGEEQQLDFYSPYGCSKGVADQYILDYARIYGLRTVSVRQSCIYGPHQLGIEDQGWIAWFIIAILTNKPITIYGNGKQVRDILFVDDLIMFYDSVIMNIDKISGEAFNVGGGAENSLSLLEFFTLFEKITHKKIRYTFEEWRQGDQEIFISDNTKANKFLKFKPKITYKDGIYMIHKWLKKYYSINKKPQAISTEINP
jgi:CDP-paratose 2-epimerase